MRKNYLALSLFLFISALQTKAFADIKFDERFVDDAIVNGGLKQAVKIYVNRYFEAEGNALLAQPSTPVVARDFFGNQQNLLILNQDIDASAYLIPASDNSGNAGNGCEASIDRGGFVERIQARTAFGSAIGSVKKPSTICFIANEIASSYQSMSAEQGLRVLISFAVHEHYHHFQEDPGLNSVLRNADEKAAYDLQSFVLSTANQGVPSLLSYAKILAPQTRDELPISEQNNAYRALMPGDPVIVEGPLCNLRQNDIGSWQGLDKLDVTCNYRSYGESLIMATSQLKVVAANNGIVAVQGVVGGEPYFGFYPDYLLARAYGCNLNGSRCVGKTYRTLNVDSAPRWVPAEASIEVQVVGIYTQDSGKQISRLLRYYSYQGLGFFDQMRPNAWKDVPGNQNYYIYSY